MDFQTAAENQWAAAEAAYYRAIDIAEAAEEEAEANAAALKAECKAIATAIYPEYRRECIDATGIVPNDVSDKCLWREWLVDEAERHRNPRMADAMNYHLEGEEDFTFPSQMEHDFTAAQAA
ncbi:hypothetical protein LST1_06250 [Neisseria elongata]|uniref:hypothetical protein n=1 Tax=Neisseria elongata TaxID=495 RepID=UPI002852DF72|nr:hypothetical protein LST1_06250 [Neisseria elongata]